MHSNDELDVCLLINPFDQKANGVPLRFKDRVIHFRGNGVFIVVGREIHKATACTARRYGSSLLVTNEARPTYAVTTMAAMKEGAPKRFPVDTGLIPSMKDTLAHVRHIIDFPIEYLITLKSCASFVKQTGHLKLSRSLNYRSSASKSAVKNQNRFGSILTNQ